MDDASMNKNVVESKKQSQMKEPMLRETEAQIASPPDESDGDDDAWRIRHVNRVGGSRRFRVNVLQ